MSNQKNHASKNSDSTTHAGKNINLRSVIRGAGFDDQGQPVAIVWPNVYIETPEEIVRDLNAQGLASDVYGQLREQFDPDPARIKETRVDVVNYLLQSRRPLLALDALGYALEAKAADGFTYRAYGIKHRLSHERVRQFVQAIQKRFNLPPRPDEKPHSKPSQARAKTEGNI
jgi:hypothetical protein